MSNFELSEIPSELVRLALRETIENLTLNSTRDRVKITSVSSKVITDSGAGIVCCISFTTTHETNRSTSSSSSLILKVSSQNLTRRMFMLSRQCFVREIFVYTEVCNHFSIQNVHVM